MDDDEEYEEREERERPGNYTWWNHPPAPCGAGPDWCDYCG